MLRFIMFCAVVLFSAAGCTVSTDQELAMTAEVMNVTHADMQDDFHDSFITFDSVSLRIIEPSGGQTLKVYFESPKQDRFFVGQQIKFQISPDSMKSYRNGDILFLGALKQLQTVEK